MLGDSHQGLADNVHSSGLSALLTAILECIANELLGKGKH